MKIKTNKQPQGSMLLVTMLTAFIVGMALASYLTLVSVQNQSTLRSQSWNSAVPVMEAGVEEALTALQYYGTTNLASGGWTLNSYDGFYHTTSTLRNGNSQNGYSYDVGIKRPALGQPDQPIIESLGYAPAPCSCCAAGATEPRHILQRRLMELQTSLRNDPGRDDSFIHTRYPDDQAQSARGGQERSHF